MSPELDSDGDAAPTAEDAGIDDWATALSAAGIDRVAAGEPVAWRRAPEQVAVREEAAGLVEVHAGVLDGDPLLLVLVLLARDEQDGTVVASMLSGRPVAHAEGPLLGPHGVLPEAACDQAVETFVDAVAARRAEPTDSVG